MINITLKEYQSTKTLNPKLKLTTKDILEIDKLNKLAKAKIFEIKPNNHIQATQFVGIVKINNKNIQVLPKIIWENTNQIVKNLLYMLSYTKKLSIKESDIAQLGIVKNLFEVFVYIFAKELLKLLQTWVKKNYHLLQDNLSFLKWKILFSQHIKHNIVNKSKFFVEYENMDENILLNQFFKSCAKKLLKFTSSSENYKLLKKIIFILQDVDDVIFPHPASLAKIKFTRQNKNYQNVFKLWKLLYFGNSSDFSRNSFDNFSLLFDMNILFEEFIGEFIKQHKQQINPEIEKVSLQVANKYVFENKKFRLKPDIVIDFADKNRIIIDTKYKKLDTNKPYAWVNPSDIYQMFMYGLRYFSTEEKNIILLYPKYNETVQHQYISEEKIKIFIRTIDLNIDLSTTEGKNNLIKQLNRFILVN